MKSILTILSVSIIFLVSGCKQAENKKAESSEESTPEITFQTLDYDYGTIEYNGDGEHDFVFENTGDSPLVLKNVKTSCGCTASEWPKEPIEVGESGKIKVSYRTTIPGNFNKSITVYSNASNPVVTLRIKGSVEKAAAAAEAT